jgi:chromosomal replication initiation ATPase DnaA
MKKTKKYIEFKQDTEIYENILTAMESSTGVHRDFFRFKRTRTRVEVRLRYILVYFIHKYIPSWSLDQVSQKVKMGDHSSVIHALKKVDDWQTTSIAHKEEMDTFNKIQEAYGQRNEITV